MKALARVAGFAALCACAEASKSSDEAAPFAAAGITSLQDGVSPTKSYAGTRDTMIDGGSAKTHHDDETAISADGDDLEEILLGWDIAAIPPTGVGSTRSARMAETRPASSSGRAIGSSRWM